MPFFPLHGKIARTSHKPVSWVTLGEKAFFTLVLEVQADTSLGGNQRAAVPEDNGWVQTNSY
jgi:hypothetical protein